MVILNGTAAQIKTAAAAPRAMAAVAHQDENPANGGASSSHSNGNGHSKLPSTGRRSSRRSLFSTLLRVFLLDVPLALLFLGFLVAYGVKTVHDDFYRPLFDRSQRTDEDLNEEFTYYRRTCNEYDFSTHNVADLLISPNQTVQQSVNSMLQHGAIVIPSVLSPESIKRLREWVVQRNSDIPEEAVFPMSEGYMRKSYGIDPSESPVVAASIQEITNHPHFKEVLTTILGDPDPASSEITVITAWAGCEDQVWHSDTKNDGNAVKYARTYSHSYSFFVPLQDTTEGMGATEIAPGTHYCANDIVELCENTPNLSMALATPEHRWRAGDGALLNQHVWHRGRAHTDPNASERILFILSFLARPKYGYDPRQLSRGTYFHQKWNMWGHTLSDLSVNPLLSMRKPFSILRCLSLWKPASKSWGYDLITSGFMRFSNEQLEGELQYRFIPAVFDLFHFPAWLRGRILDEYQVGQKEAWATFLQETFDKTFKFFETVNVTVHAVYLVLVLLVAAISSRRTSGARVAGRALLRLTFSHCALLSLCLFCLHRIRTSEWGVKVQTGQMLMRPFPAVTLLTPQELAMISNGPTTLPQRSDVLIGTRYNAKFLGSYDRWLDSHPGNALFRQAVVESAPLYNKNQKSKSPHSNSLSRQLVQHVEATITDAAPMGRFLEQDYRTGDWRVMTKTEAATVIHDELVAAGNVFVNAIRNEIDYGIAEYRFGVGRGTAMARFGQLGLAHLKRQLLGSYLGKEDAAATIASPLSIGSVGWRLSASNLLLADIDLKHQTGLPYYRRAGSPADNRQKCVPGAPVMVYYPQDNSYYPGTIVKRTADDEVDDLFEVAYDDGPVDPGVPCRYMQKRTPIVEGVSVMGCFSPGMMDCYPGTILHVMPSGDIAIEFEDGDVEWRWPLTQYYVPVSHDVNVLGNKGFEDEQGGGGGGEGVSFSSEVNNEQAEEYFDDDGDGDDYDEEQAEGNDDDEYYDEEGEEEEEESEE